MPTTRRLLLRSAAAVGIGLGTPHVAHAAVTERKRSLIVIFNAGGPSHIDLFDPKPNAPPGIRGPFTPITTSSSQFHLSELLPLHAQIAHHFSLVRTIHYDGPATHQRGASIMFPPSLRTRAKVIHIPGCNWDTHGRAPYPSLLDLRQTCARYDLAWYRLIRNLVAGGTLESTLVAVLSEFGRSPRLNPDGGRDHWTKCFTVCLAGGGIRGGRAVGRSDPFGAYPAHRPVTPAEIHATLHHCLGMPTDPSKVIHELI